MRVDFPRGWRRQHKHPGEEIITILEGGSNIELEGKPPVTLKAGDVLFIPSQTMTR